MANTIKSDALKESMLARPAIWNYTRKGTCKRTVWSVLLSSWLKRLILCCP